MPTKVKPGISILITTVTDPIASPNVTAANGFIIPVTVGKIISRNQIGFQSSYEFYYFIMPTQDVTVSH